MLSSLPSCWGDETSWRGDGRELLCGLDWGVSSCQLHRLSVGDLSTNAHGVGKEYYLTRGDTQWVHQRLWFRKSVGTCCRPAARLAQTPCAPNERLLQCSAFMLSLQTVPDGLADVERDGNAQSKSLPSSSRAEIGAGRSLTEWPLENLGEKQGTRSSSHHLGVKKWFPQSWLSRSGGKKDYSRCGFQYPSLWRSSPLIQFPENQVVLGLLPFACCSHFFCTTTWIAQFQINAAVTKQPLRAQTELCDLHRWWESSADPWFHSHWNGATFIFQGSPSK